VIMFGLILDVTLHLPPHPALRGPLSANENDTTSTTTPIPPLFLRDVGPMASQRHLHRHLITTHRLGRPHQLAPPLVEGCGLAMSSPKLSASVSPWMAPNENDAGVSQTKDVERTLGKRTRRSPPPRSSFFAHNELVNNEVSIPHCLLVPRHHPGWHQTRTSPR